MPFYVIAILVVLVLVVVIVAVVVAVTRKSPSQAASPVPPVQPQTAPQLAPEPPAAAPVAKKPETLEAQALSPSMTDMMPEAPPERPATLEAQALAPSMTDMMPELGEPMADEVRIGTAELPKVGTGEIPRLSEAPTRYRTAAAQQLADAIESMTCPKCKAPTFVGTESPQEVGADGTAMYELQARCGACGHRAQLIDMKV